MIESPRWWCCTARIPAPFRKAIFAGPPTGNEVTLRFNTVLYLVDGKIVEEWITVDMLNFMTQIGALPAQP